MQFDTLTISQGDLLKRLIKLEHDLGTQHRPITGRLFKFPLLLDDPLAKQAIDEYMTKLRDSAVYLPDNMAYIAKANGVDDVTAAKRSILACRQLVTEVSFLAGTPLMMPLDPRLVYVAQKYNPVRTFTAEGTLGLGGPLSVIYPLDAPGGYQLWGRTLSPWDAFATRPGFDQPWLFKNFDQVQYYEVDHAEFDRIHDLYKAGRLELEVEDITFDPKSYEEFLRGIADEAATFVEKRNAAGKAVTQEERKLLEEWREAQSAQPESAGADGHIEGGVDVVAPMTSSLWKIMVQVGDTVKEGDVLVILEAMKMEIRECCSSYAA